MVDDVRQMLANILTYSLDSICENGNRSSYGYIGYTKCCISKKKSDFVVVLANDLKNEWIKDLIDRYEKGLL